MSKHITLHLSDEQRTHLNSLLHSGNAPARTQTRARILLLTDRSQGQQRTDEQIAAVLGVCKPTIIRIRRRCVQEGLEAALYERARPGKTPKITGEVEAALTLLACSDPPEGQARWTLRLLAAQMVELGYVDSLSNVAVYQRLKKTKSSPGE